jgi:hypothetical protein
MRERSDIEVDLLDFKDRGTVIGHYLKSADSETFSVGVVLGVSRTHVVLGCLDEYGEEDGCSISPIDDIAKIEVGDVYIESIRLLFESADNYRKSSYDAWRETLRIGDNHDGPSYTSLLAQARSDQNMVTIYEYDGPATSGFVKQCSDEFCTMSVVSCNGEENGNLILGLDNVRKICYSGKRERKLIRLMHIHRGSDVS